MNASEKRAALVKELDSLVMHVKAGDMDSITRADEIVTELEQVDEHLAKAAAKAEKLSALGQTSAPRSKKGIKMEAKNLGEAVVESVKNSGMARGEKAGKAVAEFKAATDTVVSPNPGDVQISNRIVALPNGRLQVRDLFPTEQVSTPTIGFYQITTEGSADTVAEDGSKPQMSAEPELVTTSLKKVAAIIKVTDEMIEDYPRLASVVQERGVYAKDLAVEDQLINGAGSGADLEGLLNAGISTDTYANGADAQAKAEAIYEAAMKIKADTGYDADAVILNPADWEGIRLAKDANEQYLGGGFFQNAYGNGGYGLTPDLWGMRVALSSYVTEGTIIVGAFRQASAVAVKGGTRVTTGYDGSDFSHDRVTLRIEERVALEVFAPAGFVALTEASE